VVSRGVYHSLFNIKEAAMSKYSNNLPTLHTFELTGQKMFENVVAFIGGMFNYFC
jgi:hypothetical protein